MYQTTVTRTALGRIAQIGALYDVTTESFVHDSLFSKKLDECSVDTSVLGDTSVEIFKSDSHHDKCSKLNISGEMQVSIWAGLVKLSGSGTYLEDKKSSARSQGISLVYKLRTVNDELTIRHHNDDINTTLLTSEGNPVATHVVVGIDYGAICFATCICENSEGDDRTKVEGALKAEVGKASLGGGVSKITEEEENEYQFFFKYESDVSSITELLPVSFESAVEMARSLPKLVEKTPNGKGVPLLYTLMPLDTVAKILGHEVALGRPFVTIKGDIIMQITHVLAKSTEKRQKLFDINTDLSASEEYIEEGRLEQFSEYVNKTNHSIRDLKAGLSELLKKVRRQEIDESELVRFLREKLDVTLLGEHVMTAPRWQHVPRSKPVMTASHGQHVPLRGDHVMTASHGQHVPRSKHVMTASHGQHVPLRGEHVMTASHGQHMTDFQRDINKLKLVKEWKKRGIIYLGKSDLLLTDSKETVYVYYRPQVEAINTREEYFLRCQKKYSKHTEVAFNVVDRSIRPDIWKGDPSIVLYIKGTRVTNSNHQEYLPEYPFVSEYKKEILNSAIE